jgi:capsular exopolysaccharide synthesis family protein
VTTIEYADQATVLNKKSRLLEAGAASFGGLFLGLFVVAFREARTRRIYTPAEVARGLRLRVMGTLPALPARRLSPRERPNASSGAAWNRLLIESIDSVRTMLLQGRPPGQTSLLMIASACSGEGKTTLAGHLAASLARAGCRTLLVDCDLRSPYLHRLFDLSRTPGMCEVLTGTTRAEEAVHPTSVERLSFLPAGEYSEEAATALAQGALHEVFQQLRGDFDFIIIDSSPVLAVPDALMIGKNVDGVVFSIRPGVSQAPLVYAAYERFQELGLPFVGAVVNGVADRSAYANNYQYLVRSGSNASRGAS